MKFRFRLVEELLDESAKTDFVDKFGQDRLNNFDKARQRMKNRGLSVDYQSYLKMTSKELDDFIASLYDQKKDAQKVRMLLGTDKEIRGKYNYLGRYGKYEVYEPLDYIASMDLGVNTGWCTTGRYGHYGHPEFTPSERNAKKHFSDYTSNDKRLIYLLDPQTMYGEYAISIYPTTFEVDERIETKDSICYLKSANFKIYNAQDEVTWDIDIISQQLIDKLGLFADVINIIDLGNPTKASPQLVKNITLLSVEEARKFSQEIRTYSNWWWLRSPGRNSDQASHVNNGGSIFNYGFVDDGAIAVRPALIIDSPDIKSGDIVEVFDKKWYYQDGFALLMDKPLTRMAFNKDWHKGNDYEKSDIKKYLDKWLKEQRGWHYEV